MGLDSKKGSQARYRACWVVVRQTVLDAQRNAQHSILYAHEQLERRWLSPGRHRLCGSPQHVKRSSRNAARLNHLFYRDLAEVILRSSIFSRSYWSRPGRVIKMEWALTFVALMCSPGDRLIDLSAKLPHAVKSVDLLVSIEPFYARLYIYQPGFPDSSQGCCRNQLSSVLKLPVIDGRWCLRQSQPQMKWKIQIIARPDAAV